MQGFLFILTNRAKFIVLFFFIQSVCNGQEFIPVDKLPSKNILYHSKCCNPLHVRDFTYLAENDKKIKKAIFLETTKNIPDTIETEIYNIYGYLEHAVEKYYIDKLIIDYYYRFIGDTIFISIISKEHSSINTKIIEEKNSELTFVNGYLIKEILIYKEKKISNFTEWKYLDRKPEEKIEYEMDSLNTLNKNTYKKTFLHFEIDSITTKDVARIRMYIYSSNKYYKEIYGEKSHESDDEIYVIYFCKKINNIWVFSSEDHKCINTAGIKMTQKGTHRDKLIKKYEY